MPVLCLTVTITTAYSEPIYVAPGYTVTPFADMPIDTRVLAFDASQNAYVAPLSDGGTGTTTIHLSAPPYSSTTPFLSYSTTPPGSTLGPAPFLSGIDFDNSGSLYTSEVINGGDAGYIRQNGNLVAELPDFRPSAFDVGGPGNQVYFTARRSSDDTFGGVYRIDGGTFTEIISGIMGTGIAVSGTGDVFISSSGADFGGFLANSVYRFSAGNYGSPGERIVTFDDGARELTFDTNGVLYVLGASAGGHTPVDVIAAPVPLPPTVLLMLGGLGMLRLMARGGRRIR
jgi:hypothetical protein